MGIFSWFFHFNKKNTVTVFPLVENICERFVFENQKSHKCKPAQTELAKRAELFKICSNSKCKNPSELKIPRDFLFLLFGDKPSKNCINSVKFAGNRLCNLQASIKINFGATTDFPNSWHCQNSVRNLIKNGNSGVSRRGVNSENLRDLGKVWLFFDEAALIRFLNQFFF